MFYTKQKHEIVFYRNYKTVYSKKYGAMLENVLIKFDRNNIEFQTFDNILLSVLNECISLKQKHLRTNNAGFTTKDMQIAITERSKLRNHFVKHKMESSRITYNKQRNFSTGLIRKSKTFYFQNLDTKFVTYNKKFWKSVSPLFSNKVRSKDQITLVENYEIISDDAKIAKILKTILIKYLKI